MTDLFKLILGVLASLFRSRTNLEAEILVLRQQINVLRRRASKRPHFNNTDRFLFVWLYRWFPSVLDAIAIVRPETIVRWHRAGFRAYWRWRSRNRVGRPKVSIELRTLIGEMSCANRLWGAPRIHGELLKLGFDDQIDLELDELGSDLGEAFRAPFGPAVLDRNIAILNPTELAQPLDKSRDPLALDQSRGRAQEADGR